jgi:hypothetical protein
LLFIQHVRDDDANSEMLLSMHVADDLVTRLPADFKTIRSQRSSANSNTADDGAKGTSSAAANGTSGSAANVSASETSNGGES